jgi:hypothetical protein
LILELRRDAMQAEDVRLKENTACRFGEEFVESLSKIFFEIE